MCYLVIHFFSSEVVIMSDTTEIRRCRALLGGCPGPIGPPGPAGPAGPQGPQGTPGGGVPPVYGSFLSDTTQSAGTPNPVAITYSAKTLGNMNVSGAFPTSQIVIPVTGVYKVLFSVQCNSSSGIHYLEIFPVINGNTVADSNTRIRLTVNVESVMTIEYFLSFNANDILQLYMVGDSTNAVILALPGNPSTTPPTPAIPSIIVTIMQIA